MKKLFALLLLLLIAFLYINRNRVYVRDPLAKVTRDGVAVADVKVMINYPNDVLLDDQSLPARHRLYLVQHWNKLLSAPSAPLQCISGVACMLDQDQATATPIAPGARGRRSAFEGVTMTDRRAEFVDEDGALVEVTLR